MKSFPLSQVYDYCGTHPVTVEAVARRRVSLAQVETSAFGRAVIALRMLVGAPLWSDGYERALDDCFEMNDGDEVVATLVRIAEADSRVRQLLESHVNTRGCLAGWIESARKSAEGELALGIL